MGTPNRKFNQIPTGKGIPQAPVNTPSRTRRAIRRYGPAVAVGLAATLAVSRLHDKAVRDSEARWDYRKPPIERKVGLTSEARRAMLARDLARTRVTKNPRFWQAVAKYYKWDLTDPTVRSRRLAAIGLIERVAKKTSVSPRRIVRTLRDFEPTDHSIFTARASAIKNRSEIVNVLETMKRELYGYKDTYETARTDRMPFFDDFLIEVQTKARISEDFGE